jgi:hypothetical protein
MQSINYMAPLPYNGNFGGPDVIFAGGDVADILAGQLRQPA